MVYSISNIISNQNDYDIFSSTNSISTSCFIESLDYIIEEDIQISKIFNEAFNIKIKKFMISKINFKSILESIGQWFLGIIDKIIGNAKAAIIAITSKGRVIRKFEKELKLYDHGVDYKEVFIKYTNLDDISNSRSTFRAEMNEIEINFNYIFEKQLKKATIENKISILDKELNRNIDDIMNGVRGDLLALSDNEYRDVLIEENKFAQELYNYFRNYGSVSISGDYLGSDDIRNIYYRYENLNKTIDKIKKDEKYLKDVSKEFIKKMKNKQLTDYVKDEERDEIKSRFVILTKNFIKRIKDTYNIYLQFFSAKIDAIKECHEQDIKILTEACKLLVKNGGDKNDK